MSELYRLPDGWEWKKLEDIVRIGCEKGFKPVLINNQVPFIGMSDIDEYSGRNTQYILEDNEKVSKGKTKFQKNAILLGKITPCTQNNKTTIVPNDIDGGYATTEVYALHCLEKIIPLYLNFYLRSKAVNELLVDSMIGATGRQRVPSDAVKNLLIPLPPLNEQKRIVAKLDTLFEKIDKAIALHQRNMDEADALMGSVLNEVFGELEEKYGLKQIQSLFKIKSGDFLPKKKMVEDGNIDVYGGNGINGTHNEFNLSGENIIIGRVGALCGNVRCVNGNIWLTDNAFYISDYFEDIDKKYLTQMLIHIDLGSSANQAAQPVISYKGISEMKLPLPPLNIQQKVVKYLDEISQKVEILKQVQNDKMASLKALKASILDQAFRGEL